ncbi:HEAT repeat domain-containing protein [Saccharopolyspora indica]|uniref:HEAT repeat domain-containing protein n=1 Tax=Saccharopolyspora indica TaxID=1229659 RepID=UPI0022EAED4B|nr:HEAT repeat domain-containing protein [Saccharopolyspora indica]MDA3648851.1 HEAT repeat domain-containing protein [Saccharopolyspora indica]
MTIQSAAEFVRLRSSVVPEEYRRAADEDAPLEVWRRVVDEYPSMREWVVHNKTVPVEILEALASDADPAVRFRVAMKRKAPPRVLEVLAEDPDESVRERVSSNKKTPNYLLEKLIADPSEVVREAARKNLSGRG